LIKLLIWAVKISRLVRGFFVSEENCTRLVVEERASDFEHEGSHLNSHFSYFQVQLIFDWPGV